MQVGIKHTENLLNALLRRRENSEDTVEELNDYVSDLKNGELLESDARYIQALAKRLGVVAGSGAAPEGAGSEPDTSGPDTSGPDTAEPDTAEPDTAGPDVPDVEALDPEFPDSEAPGPQVPRLEVVTGSFVERARTIARDTIDKHRPPDETDRQTVLDRVSEQLDGLAARLEEEVLKDARGDGVLSVPTGHLRMTLMRDPETPALFTHENERELETTPGYIKLAAACDELMLRLRFERGHEEGYQEQGDSGAPPLYPVDLVISGWV